MIQRFFNLLTMGALVFFIALAVFSIPSFFDPEFVLVNHSSKEVSVTATWRDREKQIDGIGSMSSYRFSVDDEAAIIFKVRYANGREAETEPRYFTHGIEVIVTISDEKVEVRYGHETQAIAMKGNG